MTHRAVRRVILATIAAIVAALLLVRCAPTIPEPITAVHETYLPGVMLPTKRCGSEFWRGDALRWSGLLADTGCRWVRMNWGTNSDPNLYQIYFESGDDIASVAAFGDNVVAAQDAGLTPIAVFHGNRDGSCGPMPAAHHAHFAAFVSEVVSMYNLKYIEIWNEPDNNAGGFPNLFGCWGIGDAQLLIDLLAAVRAALPVPNPQVGVSFTSATEQQFPMIEKIAASGHVDFIGLHHYEDHAAWPGEEAWPGGLAGKVERAREFWDGPVFVTETNLLDFTDTCGGDFNAKQASYVTDAMRSGADAVFIYAFVKQVGWHCAALMDSDGNTLPAYDALKNGMVDIGG